METNSDLNCKNGSLYVRGREIPLEHPVDYSFKWRDKIILMYDPDAIVEKFGQFQNLIAIDSNGEMHWTAELPTTKTGDRYTEISSENPLIVNSFHSYVCEIDPETGKIVTKIFTK